LFYLECIECGQKYRSGEIVYLCGKCGNILDVRYDYGEIGSTISLDALRQRPLSVWRYRELLPITNELKRVTLGEGNTKLYDAVSIGKKLKLRRLYIKNEGDNPTGSFKDRGMTVGVTKALEFGIKTVTCASTGNTSASLAAYATKAEISCVVITPSHKIAHGKLAQAIVYGAHVVQIRGNFDEALRIVLELSLSHKGVYLLNSVNPYRLEGQKTLAYEIIDQLDGQIPDKVIVPVGNAGNISAIWKGFQEFKKLDFIDSLPQMVGIQASGAAPIAKAVKAGKDIIDPVNEPETVATAIRIGSPVSWKKAVRAIRQSGGNAEIVTDMEIMEAQKLLARSEGIFVEPAGASSIAGLKKLMEKGKIAKDDVVACVTTGHGLKDPDAPIEFCEKPVEVDAEPDAVRKIMGV